MSKSVKRDRKGALLGMVAVLALALVMIVLAFFVISLYLGGGREVRNATDAGALNVGKKVLTLTTSSQGGDEDQFKDVADSNNEFGLTNLNRVWGKALWAAINAEDIKADSCTNADTNNHVGAMYDAAEHISDRISDKLNDPNNLYPFFDTLAKQNSVRMLGEQSTTNARHESAGGKWITSLMNRGEESNLIITDKQIPKNVLNGSGVPTVKAANNDKCLPGYKGVNMFGRNYWFVPFKFNERPRLESRNHFDAATLTKQPLSPAWAKAVPNAYSCEAETTGGASANEKALAYVKANPMRTFKATIPHGFLRLKFEDNVACWFYGPVAVPYLAVIPALIIPPGDVSLTKTSYGYKTSSQWREIPVPACGSGTAKVTLGNEYGSDNSVWNCLFPMLQPQPCHLTLAKRISQRIREIKPDFEDAELFGILHTAFVTDSDRTFYIVPVGGQIMCLPESKVTTLAPWMSDVKNTAADSDKYTYDELFPPFLEQNKVDTWFVKCFSISTPTGASVSSQADGDGDLDWKGGTGYNGFLGEVTVKRETNLRFTATCGCIE